MAIIFYIIPNNFYLYWVIAALVSTLILFFLRPGEPLPDGKGKTIIKSKFWLIPAAAVLTLAGYFLDPVVSFAAEHSHAPKGVIGFIILSTLTSWPEFKSSISLLNRNKPSAAILNITVSNITNIWLAVAGISVYLFSQ
jgi:cation:H+ antiporter